MCKLVSQRLLKKGIGSKEGEIVEASEKKLKNVTSSFPWFLIDWGLQCRQDRLVEHIFQSWKDFVISLRLELLQFFNDISSSRTNSNGT